MLAKLSKLWALSAAAAGGTLLLGLLPSPTAPERAVRGPGNVIRTVDAYLTTIDAGDVEQLRALLSDDGGADPYRVEERDGKRRIVRSKNRAPAVFCEVGCTGESVTAADRDALLKALTATLGPSLAASRTVRTETRSIQAACPSAECCYAVVNFDRHYTLADGTRTTVPLQATALMRYVGNKDPHFQIFHWHASLRGPVQTHAAKKASASARRH